MRDAQALPIRMLKVTLDWILMDLIVDILETNCDDFRNCENYHPRVWFVWSGIFSQFLKFNARLSQWFTICNIWLVLMDLIISFTSHVGLSWKIQENFREICGAWWPSKVKEIKQISPICDNVLTFEGDDFPGHYKNLVWIYLMSFYH